MASPRPWLIRIDTGGTFTDCWAIDPDDAAGPRQVKLLSSGVLRVAVSEWLSPKKCRVEVPESWRTPDNFFVGFEGPVEDWNHAHSILTLSEEISSEPTTLDLTTGEEAPVIGIRLLTGTAPGEKFPPIELRLATTRGTNALLERKGAGVAFFITRGFGDLLHIRDQRRRDLFALEHHQPSPIPQTFIEVDERLDAGGEVITPLETGSIDAEARTARDGGCDTAAVALLHSYRNPTHERQLRDHLKSLGFSHVSISSELAPLIKILPRAETAAINATLTPVMQTFIDRIRNVLSTSSGLQMLTMTSAGGLESPDDFHPKDSLFSGPAGGVVGAAAVGRAAGYDKLITFDMGGTSTDVARYDGDFQYQFEQRIGDAALLSPALKIATVAAGGGSICYRDANGALRVGPESAGADPGPACYGRGGPLTITDVNLLLGRIDAENFGIPLGAENFAAAERAAATLAADAAGDPPFLQGLLDIAVEQMADSIRAISVREGADPAEYPLLAFGGAGPLHACAIADRLGIATVIVPAEAGILSAFGLHHAVVERFAERQLLQPLKTVIRELPQILSQMADEARGRFAEGVTGLSVRRQIAELRLVGQDAPLSVDIDEPQNLSDDFATRYEATFGYPPPSDRAIELVALRVAVSTAAPESASIAPGSSPKAPSSAAAFIDRQSLTADQVIAGPKAIQDPFSTCWVASGWSAVAGEGGRLTLSRTGRDSIARAEHPQAIRHELFRHRFTAIVEEMGAMLERSAVSTNVKERLDFSCALLDAGGNLIVNAPHIPVHLGALGLCVREVVKGHSFRRGDMIVTNHPACGGSHLPDVTVISAVFNADDELAGYVANRAHHAEIGGISPGSMPPAAASLAEEGVVIPPTLIFEEGVSRFDAIATLLREAPHPTRNLADNLADLNAQVAANRRGIAALENLLYRHGRETIHAEFAALSAAAADSMSRRLRESEFVEASCEQKLDDGTQICVRAKLDAGIGRLRLDFSGTSASHPGNLNATPAIVRSALLYVMRLWAGENLPLNEGLASHIDVVLPRCFLNPDFPEDPGLCPAVVGGNVETSQRLVDALIKLFELQACSQGTMNNLIFGDDHFGYYETIGGGAGAGPGYAGASGLHTHMTNTAITDPEILENRYPVRLRRFELRRESGGAGQYRGGDGLIREMEFLSEVEVSLLTQHRSEAPFGMADGEAGKCGRQILTQPDATSLELESVTTFRAIKGTLLRIETPGGGAWGKSNSLLKKSARQAAGHFGGWRGGVKKRCEHRD